MNVKPPQRRRILLVRWLHFQNHLVFVRRGVDSRDLPRAVGVVERVFDLLRRDAERRRLVAIDVHVELRILDLNVAGHIQQLRQGRDLFLQFRSLRVKFISIRTLQRQLVRTLRDLSAHLHERWILQIDAHPGHRGKLRAQVGDNRFYILLALRQRLQQNQDVAGVAGGANVALAHG